MRAYIGAGSNLGDRRAHLDGALAGLSEQCPVRSSPIYETVPAGPVVDQPPDVYRRDDQGWSQHNGSNWNTMAELERQYGPSGRNTVGEVGPAPPQQQQAYKQNEADIERMERYYQSRQKSYNMYGTVTVRH